MKVLLAFYMMAASLLPSAEMIAEYNPSPLSAAPPSIRGNFPKSEFDNVRSFLSGYCKKAVSRNGKVAYEYCTDDMDGKGALVRVYDQKSGGQIGNWERIWLKDQFNGEFTLSGISVSPSGDFCLLRGIGQKESLIVIDKNGLPWAELESHVVSSWMNSGDLETLLLQSKTESWLGIFDTHLNYLWRSKDFSGDILISKDQKVFAYFNKYHDIIVKDAKGAQLTVWENPNGYVSEENKNELKKVPHRLSLLKIFNSGHVVFYRDDLGEFHLVSPGGKSNLLKRIPSGFGYLGAFNEKLKRFQIGFGKNIKGVLELREIPNAKD